MKRLRYLVFVVLCAFLSPLVIKAQCTDQRMAELNKIASNVQISYNYDLDEKGEPNFYVNISNVAEDIYVVDSFGNVYRNFENVMTSYSIYLYIYSNDPNCPGELVKRNINYPYFNEYYNIEECKGNSNPLCGLWQDTEEYDEESFKKNIVDSSPIKNNVTLQKKNNDVNNNYIIYIVLTVLVIVIALIFLMLKLFSRRDGLNDK